MTDLAPLLPLLENDEDVLAAYLFGSRSWGASRPDSDLDIAVMLDPALNDRQVWQKRLLLGAQLAEMSHREVDLTILGESDLDLTFRILQKGQRFFERNRPLVRDREARLVNLFWDYQPFLERYLAGTACHFKSRG